MQIYVSNKNALHSDGGGLKARPKRYTFGVRCWVVHLLFWQEVYNIGEGSDWIW